jgi:hypothetical protein
VFFAKQDPSVLNKSKFVGFFFFVFEFWTQTSYLSAAFIHTHTHTHTHTHPNTHTHTFKIFLVVLIFVFRALCFLGRYSTTSVTSPALFCFSYFGDRVSSFCLGQPAL